MGRILVADDNEDTCQLIALALQGRGGWDCAVVGTIDEMLIALDNATKAGAPFDLLLLDAIMPNGSYPEVLPMIARISPDTRIIVMSGHIDLTEEALRIGHTTLEKPFSIRRLWTAMSEAMENGSPNPSAVVMPDFSLFRRVSGRPLLLIDTLGNELAMCGFLILRGLWGIAVYLGVELGVMSLPLLVATTRLEYEVFVGPMLVIVGLWGVVAIRSRQLQSRMYFLFASAAAFGWLSVVAALSFAPERALVYGWISATAGFAYLRFSKRMRRHLS